MNTLVDYIKTHPHWRKELVEKPFCLTIKDDGPYTIFSYSQIDSDFYNEVVRVSRGIILKITEKLNFDDLSDMFDAKIVCWPFNKFGNFGEGYADKIDWASARVQEKVDGSIIKIWYDDGWHVSTNGMISAFTCDLMNPTDEFKCFGDLVMKAWSNSRYGLGDFYDACMNRNITYIFELVSPWNRVVVPYKDIKLYFIGARDNITGEEIDPVNCKEIEHFDRPQVYPFGTFEEAVANAAALPFSQEGYVVVDKDWRRNKIKSKAYLQAHHLKSNGNVNPNRVLELIKTNEQDEFISYFPEYKEHFDRIREKYENTMVQIFSIKEQVETIKARSATRKDFALEVLEMPEKLRKYYFTAYDGDSEKLKKLIGALDYEDLL